MQSARTDHIDLKLLVALLAVAGIVFHMGQALSGHGLLREQHLATAVEYAKFRIDLLHPIVPGMSANRVPTPLDFPVWQAGVAVLMKMFGVWHGWGNVLSLFFHFSALWPLFQFARTVFSTRVAWWSLVFYLAQPLTFLWGGMAGGDSTAAAFAIWFAFFCWRILAGGGWRWWPIAAVTGCLSATTKAPFFAVTGLAAFFWLLAECRRSRGAWLQLASVGAVSMLALLLWNHHTARCYAAAEFLADERLANPALLRKWLFGDLQVRLHAATWFRILWRSSTILVGGPGMLFLPTLGWFLPGTKLLRLWMLAAVCTMLVFTNVIAIHFHYYYILSAPVALLCARALAEFEPGIWQRFPAGRFVRCLVPAAASAMILFQGLRVGHANLMLDPHTRICSKVIQEHTAPTDKLVVWGWGGGFGEPFFRAQRDGVGIYNFEPIIDPRKLSRLKELGCNKLVLLNQSPLLVAVTTATGSNGGTILDLPSEVPNVAKGWNISFRSPLVLILDIPK